MRRALRPASPFALITRHDAGRGARDGAVARGVAGRVMADHSRVVVAVRSDAGCWCGGPELGGAARGRDLGVGRAAGERERVERALDLLGWAVVLQRVVDLAAGQSAGVGLA